jgi:glycosyltransferase involved in cell wall biosynthesis
MRAGVLLEALASYGAVHLLVIPLFDLHRKTLPERVRPFCSQYHILTVSKLTRCIARLRGFIHQVYRQRSLPYEWCFASDASLRRTAHVFHEVRFAYLYVFRLYMAPFASAYFSQAELKGRYLDIDDVESVTRSRLAILYRANGRHRQAHQEQQRAHQYAGYERDWLPKFDGLSVCSPQDKTRINRLVSNHPICILPNVVRMPADSRPVARTKTFHMLFIGNLNYYPNQDAIAFFLTRILPLLRAQTHRLLCFTVIGSGTWRGLRQYRHVVEWRYVGFVPDVAPYYHQANAVVVPLRAGGGTRIKVLEAFSFNRPVVSTSLGVEGLGVVHDTHVLVADEPEAFAAQCNRLIADEELTTALTTQALTWLRANYTLDVLRQRLGQAMAGRA